MKVSLSNNFSWFRFLWPVGFVISVASSVMCVLKSESDRGWNLSMLEVIGALLDFLFTLGIPNSRLLVLRVSVLLNRSVHSKQDEQLPGRKHHIHSI